MTYHADTNRRPARVERVEEWANLYGNELADILRLDPEDDAATLAAIDDALMLVEDVYALLAERQQAIDALQRLAEWKAPNRLAAVEAIHDFARAELAKLGETETR